MTSRATRLLATAAAALLLAAAAARAQQGPLVADSYRLSEAAGKAIDAEWLTDDERSALRVFHGVWDQRDLRTPEAEAIVALNAWDFDDPALSDPDVPPVIRAEARLHAGELEEAIAILEGIDTTAAGRIRAEAYEMLGDFEAADAAVEDPAKILTGRKTSSAAELTEGVRALIVRSRLRGQPARDFQTMLNLLARAHQDLDRLYWPAKLAEARLLLDKDKYEEGVAALKETLELNPRCAEAWFLLGRVAITRFDFFSGDVAAESLRRQNPQHPLADMLLAESRLIQDDPAGAMELLEPLVERLPSVRRAHALIAAAAAISYDEQAMRAALERYEQLSPGSAQAYFLVGRHLSLNRQYEAAAEALEEAIRRQPAWPEPRIELGLMELQSGREIRARDALLEVAKLDPFNNRAANSLFLIEEMAGYAQIETPHFIIRYAPGVDEVMARMMPEKLEEIHRTVSGRFGFEPDRKTTIELLPDHERFGVRITGMPWIHTVAACTGPVIALEVPKEGKPSEHLGLFDWPRVLQHEYTHTITLAQTRNRIPHWLTEAAAVSMEMAPRDYGTCQMLVDAYQQGTLFDLDDIKWAFIRPKEHGDRSKAYAQGHWMVQYMDQRFGASALVRLLGFYFQGMREAEAIPEALGISREQFFSDFLDWAGEEIKEWGFGAEPSLVELTDELRMDDPELAVVMHASRQARLDTIAQRLNDQIGQAARPRVKPLKARQWPSLVRPPVEITEEQLAAWLEEHPNHPDLVEIDLRRRLERAEAQGDAAAAAGHLVPYLERYADLRPVDPLPHKKLADIYLDSDTPEQAIEHLEELDIREEKSPVYAVKLASLYREAGQLDRALDKATRALHINPYQAFNRELAAAIAIEAGDLPTAREHIWALTLLEPGRPQHEKRLKRIDEILAARE